jgi:hypothetical protein
MAIDLPEGFQWDQSQNNGLPEGFQLDEPQPQQPQMGRGEAAFITATNPLNFGDEIKAGISALTAKIMGGAATKDIDIGDLYHEARTSERAKLEQAKKTYPVQSGLIGFASDIPLEAAALGNKMGGRFALPLVEGATKAGANLASKFIPKLGENAAGLAIQGGILGTLGGAGESEADTIGGVAKDALTSGAIGASAAPILAAATPKVVDIIGKGASGIKNMFTRTTGEQVVGEAVSPQAAKFGLDTLKASPEGQPTTALDINHPEFQALAVKAVQKNPQAKQIAADFVNGRQADAIKRIDNILSKDVSPIETYFGDFAEKQKLQKIRGEENYNKAYAAIPNNTKTINQLDYRFAKDMNSKFGGKMKSGFYTNQDISNRSNNKVALLDDYKAKRAILLESPKDQFGEHIYKDKELSNLVNTRPDFVLPAAKEAADLLQIEKGIKVNPQDLLQISTRNVDMIKRGLDSLINKETDALGKTSPKGKALEGYKRQLMDRMDVLNPDYKTARNIYAGDFAVQNAQELGRKFNTMQPEEILLKMKSYGQSEKDAFRIGQRLKLQELADKSKIPADKLFGNENIRKQLKASFEGKEDKFQEFAQRLTEEANYNNTIKKLGLNKAEVEDSHKGLINLIARAISKSKTGVVFEGVRAAETALIKQYNGLTNRNAKELIQIFSNKEASIKVLQSIVDKADEAQKPIIQQAISDIYPAILAGHIGSNTTEKQSK